MPKMSVLAMAALLTTTANAFDDPCRDKVTDKARNAAAKMIRLFGYDCRKVDAMCPYVFSEGYNVYCNDMRYKFEVENHGGKWSVTSK